MSRRWAWRTVFAIVTVLVGTIPFIFPDSSDWIREHFMPVGIRNFDADKRNVRKGETVFITWEVSESVRKVFVEPFWGEVERRGRRPLQVENDITLRLIAQGLIIRRSEPLTITVLPLPSVQISASQQVYLGEPAEIVWSAQNCEVVQIEGLDQQFGSSGSLTISPSSLGKLSYRLKAIGPGGEIVKTVELTVVDRPVPPREFVLPAGTKLKVRSATEISAETHEEGDFFETTLEYDLSTDGELIAPKGTKTKGLVVSNVKAEDGSERLAIKLIGLYLPNQGMVALDTTIIEKFGSSGNQRTFGNIGLAAGGGAAAGGFVGGKKGAAAGAASGAIFGWLSRLGRNKSAIFKKGSALSFELLSPLTITQTDQPKVR